jgi:hypothetical protein
VEKNIDENREAYIVQVTDLDEDEIKIKNVSESTNDINFKKETKGTVDCTQETKKLNTEDQTLYNETLIRELREKCRNLEKPKSIKTVLKRNKSCANDVKVTFFCIFIYFC